MRRRKPGPAFQSAPTLPSSFSFPCLAFSRSLPRVRNGNTKYSISWDAPPLPPKKKRGGDKRKKERIEHFSTDDLSAGAAPLLKPFARLRSVQRGTRSILRGREHSTFQRGEKYQRERRLLHAPAATFRWGDFELAHKATRACFLMADRTPRVCFVHFLKRYVAGVFKCMENGNFQR